MNDCGGCKFCLDKRKFGGPGKLKKRCELRVCMTPRKMGAPSPKPVMSSPMTTGGPKLPLEVRNKFLTTIENRQNQQNQQIKLIENQQMTAENRSALENIIEMGLETYEVVNVNVVQGQQQGSRSGQTFVVQAAASEQKLCYLCKHDNKEDLFYCSSCCDPFHQLCLQRQVGGGAIQQVSTTCGRCAGGKGDYEQAMNARAESIHAKCEEIDGAQYQVISFLTDAEHLKMPDMILQVEDEEDEEAVAVASVIPPNSNQAPNTYDNDFDAYLHTISLAN